MSFASVQNSNASFNNLFSNVLTFSDGTSQTTAASGSSILTTNNTFTGTNTFQKDVTLSGNINMGLNLNSTNGNINLTNGNINLTNGNLTTSGIVFETLGTQTQPFLGDGNYALLDASNTFSAANNYFEEINPSIVTATTSISTPTISTESITFPRSIGLQQTQPYLGPTQFTSKNTTPISVTVNSTYATGNTATVLTVATPTSIMPSANYLVSWVAVINNLSSGTTGDLGIWVKYTISEGQINVFKYLGIPVGNTTNYSPNFLIEFSEKIQMSDPISDNTTLNIYVVDGTTGISYSIGACEAVFTQIVGQA
jgi:hypothetical protein